MPRYRKIVNNEARNVKRKQEITSGEKSNNVLATEMTQAFIVFFVNNHRTAIIVPRMYCRDALCTFMTAIFCFACPAVVLWYSQKHCKYATQYLRVITTCAYPEVKPSRRMSRD